MESFYFSPLKPILSFRGVCRTAIVLVFALCDSSNIVFAQTITVSSVPVNNMPTNNTAGEVNITLNGDGTADHPLEIGSVNEWNAFATYVNQGNAGVHAKITADITFKNSHLQPHQFSGTLDGQGHTITLHQSDEKEAGTFPYKDTDSSWGGLFFHIKSGVKIMNLRVAGEIRNRSCDCGTIAQNVSGSNVLLENCQSSVTIVYTVKSPSGSTTGKHNGGMIGCVTNPTTIKNCLVDGKFTTNYNEEGENPYNGGFVGRLYDSSDNSLNIQNSYAHPQEIESRYTHYSPFCSRYFVTSFSSGNPNEKFSRATLNIQDSYYKLPSGFENIETRDTYQLTDKEAPGTAPSPTTKEETVTALNTNLSTSAWELHNDTIYLKTFAKYVHIDDHVYGEDDGLRIVGNNGNGTVTYQYKVKGAEDNTYATYTPGTTVLNVGNYTLKASVAANNGWNAWESTMDFSVSQAPLTVTAEPKTITYGKAGANAGVTYTGFVNGETETTADLSGTLSFVYSSDKGGAYKAGDNVGNGYKIEPSGLTSNNYAIDFVAGTLTVEPMDLTITANDQTIEFGTEIAKGTDQVTLSPDLFDDDDLTEITLTPSTEDFTDDGTATIMPSVAVIMRDGVDKTSNYTIKYLPGKLKTAKSVVGGVPYVTGLFFDASWKTSTDKSVFLPLSYTTGSSTVELTKLLGVPKGKPVIFGNATEDPANPNLSDLFYLLSVPDASDDPTEVTAARILTDYNDAVEAMDKQHFAITDGTKTLRQVIEGTLGETVPVSDAIVMTLTGGNFRSVYISDSDLDKLARDGLLLFILSKWEYMQVGKDSNPGGGSGLARRISIGDGEANGIVSLPADNASTDDDWYTLDGRKVDQAPKAKGIYIRRGVKRVVR